MCLRWSREIEERCKERERNQDYNGRIGILYQEAWLGLGELCITQHQAELVGWLGLLQFDSICLHSYFQNQNYLDSVLDPFSMS